MKRFAFRLERVLELRRFRERQSEIALAEKAGRVALIERQLDENAASSARTVADRFAEGRTFEEARYAERYLARLVVERERLAKSLVAAERERDKARAEYVERRKARGAIDKLRDKALEEHSREAGREEARDLDDIATSARLRNPAYEEVLEL